MITLYLLFNSFTIFFLESIGFCVVKIITVFSLGLLKYLINESVILSSNLSLPNISALVTTKYFLLSSKEKYDASSKTSFILLLFKLKISYLLSFVIFFISLFISL